MSSAVPRARVPFHRAVESRVATRIIVMLVLRRTCVRDAASASASHRAARRAWAARV